LASIFASVHSAFSLNIASGLSKIAPVVFGALIVVGILAWVARKTRFAITPEQERKAIRDFLAQFTDPVAAAKQGQVPAQRHILPCRDEAFEKELDISRYPKTLLRRIPKSARQELEDAAAAIYIAQDLAIGQRISRPIYF